MNNDQFDWKKMDIIVQELRDKKPGLVDTACLSNWTPGKEYVKQLSLVLKLDQCTHAYHEYVHYPEMFVENESLKRALVSKLTTGHSCDQIALDNLDIMLCRNNTTSILDIMMYLSGIKAKKLCITVPRYFSAEVFANKLNMCYRLVDLDSESGERKIPVEKILQEKFDAVWFTSYYESFYDNAIDDIKALVKSGVICVFDECNIPYRECLANRIGVNDNLIFICSPHKAISMNGELKFSCVISTHEIVKDMINEVFSVYGTQTNMNDIPGIRHFLSSNYDNCKKLFDHKVNSNMALIKCIADENSLCIKRIKSTSSYYVVIETTFHVDDLESTTRNITKKCSHFIYPMEILDKTNHETLSFRVNLLHDKDDIKGGLNEIFQFLSSYDKK